MLPMRAGFRPGESLMGLSPGSLSPAPPLLSPEYGLRFKEGRILLPGIAFPGRFIGKIEQPVHVCLVEHIVRGRGEIPRNGRQVKVHLVPAGEGHEPVQVPDALGLDEGVDGP